MMLFVVYPKDWPLNPYSLNRMNRFTSAAPIANWSVHWPMPEATSAPVGTATPTTVAEVVVKRIGNGTGTDARLHASTHCARKSS